MRFGTNYRVCCLVSLVGLMALLPSCGKKSNPVSYLDSYIPSLTSAKGTGFSGDYFPLVSGYSWTVSGTMRETGSISMTGEPSENLDTTLILTITTTVLPATTLQLSGSSVPVFPELSVSSSSADDPFASSSSSTTFYQPTDTAVWARATQVSSSDSIIDAKNGLFLKRPLVAGDVWTVDADPSMASAVQSAMADSTIRISGVSISASSKKFVIGAETIALPGGQHDAVRIDQVSDISISFTMSDPTNASNTMAITEHLTGTMKMRFVKDTGEAMEDENMTLATSMRGTSDGQNMSLAENVTMSGTVSLVSFSKGTAVTKAAKARGPASTTFTGRCRDVARLIAMLVK